MPRLTKKEKVAQFYYNWTKFTKSMEQHESYLNRVNGYRNRRKIAAKNEMGKIKEEQSKELDLLDDGIKQAEGWANDQMKMACEAFEEMSKLLS